jgi:hypothetical protein
MQRHPLQELHGHGADHRDRWITWRPSASAGRCRDLAANIGGSSTSSGNTAAFVASGAAVNRDTDITDATTSEQSVLVAAGNDLYHMGIGGAISLAGTAAITPGADVTVITNDTRAYIDNGALVKAEKDIVVTANAKENFLSIAAGVGGAGTVGIGVAAGVLVMNNTTSAYIGDDPNRSLEDVDATGPGDGTNTDPSGLKGAVAKAGGNVLVAPRHTETLTVAGSLGVGLGAAVAVQQRHGDHQGHTGFRG